MLTESARHRLRTGVAAGEVDRQAAVVEAEPLPRFIVPRPFPGGVVEDQHRPRFADLLDDPRMTPALPMQRIWIAGHVGLEVDGPAAEVETAAADPIDVGHERERARVEHILERTVASPQYCSRAAFAGPFERRNTPTNGRA